MDIEWLLSLKLGYTTMLNDTFFVKCYQFKWKLELTWLWTQTWEQIYLYIQLFVRHLDYLFSVLDFLFLKPLKIDLWATLLQVSEDSSTHKVQYSAHHEQCWGSSSHCVPPTQPPSPHFKKSALISTISVSIRVQYHICIYQYSIQ